MFKLNAIIFVKQRTYVHNKDFTTRNREIIIQCFDITIFRL